MADENNTRFRRSSSRALDRRNALKRIGAAGTGLALGAGLLGSQSGVVSASHCYDLDAHQEMDKTTDSGGCKDLQLVQSAKVRWCDYWKSGGHNYYLFNVYTGAAAEWEGSDSEADAINYQKLNVDVCGYKGNVSVKGSSDNGYWPANDDEVQEYFKDLAHDVASQVNSYVGFSAWAIEEYKDLQDTFLSDDKNCSSNKYKIREVDRTDHVSMATHQFKILVDYEDDSADVYVDFDNIMEGYTSYWCNGFNEDYFVSTEVNINAHLWGEGNCSLY